MNESREARTSNDPPTSPVEPSIAQGRDDDTAEGIEDPRVTGEASTPPLPTDALLQAAQQRSRHRRAQQILTGAALALLALAFVVLIVEIANQ